MFLYYYFAKLKLRENLIEYLYAIVVWHSGATSYRFQYTKFIIPGVSSILESTKNKRIG